mgnify:CR=1 FL=1
MILQKLNSNFQKLPKKFPEAMRGFWVAVADGKIIDYSKDFNKLFKSVSDKGYSKKVLFHKVPKRETIIF